MIHLTDITEINSTPERIFAWLECMPHEYQSWHPDHVSCRVLSGSMTTEGSVIECQEYLHGKLHSMRFRLIKVVPDKRLEFVVEGMGRGAFEAQAMNGSARFRAELDIGTDTPFIGTLFDVVFSKLFAKRIEALKEHMAEEGQNLKTILES